MTWLLQTIFLLLTLTLLKKVFDRIHDLGVRRAVAALSRHPAVFCILGSGSYFEKRTTSGLPEADLTIVLKENVSRADAAADEIAHTYERVRRIFPFLGRWQHKEGNLIFLSDLAAGFPAPESFRVRFKQGRLAPLYGELPGGILSGTVTTSELLTEINGLLRFSLVADPRHAQRLVFWKHVFVKLSALAELLDLTNWSEETWSRTEPDLPCRERQGAVFSQKRTGSPVLAASGAEPGKSSMRSQRAKLSGAFDPLFRQPARSHAFCTGCRFRPPWIRQTTGALG